MTEIRRNEFCEYEENLKQLLTYIHFVTKANPEKSYALCKQEETLTRKGD